MSNQKTGKIRIKTSGGTYDIAYVVHTKSKTDLNAKYPRSVEAYNTDLEIDKMSYAGDVKFTSAPSFDVMWISNFWWEIPEDEQINKDAEPPKPKHCWHQWKEYVGFTERYWYCEKCDNKSQENPDKCF
jgi:hypothetical protein